MTVPLSGNIQDISLPAILEELHQSGASGTLTVRRQSVTKSILMTDGQIIFATSTDVRDRLGEMLVKAGKLSREKLEAALTLHRKSAGFKKLGAILVDHGFVAPKDLFLALKTQVKDIIFSIFLWDEAEYRFEESLPADVIHLQINMQDLIREIIERMKQES